MEEGRVAREADTGVMWPQARDYWGNILPSSPQESMTLRHLHFRLCDRDNPHLLFPVPQVRGSVTAAPGGGRKGSQSC